MVTSIMVFLGNRKIKVRLYGVDSPETKQKYGKQARQFTSRHAMGKIVRIEEKGSSVHTTGWSVSYISKICV